MNFENSCRSILCISLKEDISRRRKLACDEKDRNEVKNKLLSHLCLSHSSSMAFHASSDRYFTMTME